MCIRDSNKLNLVDFQLTEMSDRLPPLNLHALSGKFKLDPWQVNVIELIEKRKSVLITAPTSSGKTVLSTFVCSTGNRVLFVVPTEPLAWQVAAMLRALKLGICLIVPTLTFTPLQWEVVVGTPHALESALTKQLGFDFSYAVFDEVHSLNNRDGEALQRLIAAMPKECRFLALSATIGNAPQLKKWWETIVGGEGQVELVQHQARFINLQRHVWAPAPAAAAAAAADAAGAGAVDGASPPQDDSLKLLHPLSVVTTEFLATHGFDHTDMALTPLDSYRLWLALDKHVVRADDCADFDVSDLKPRKFFDDEPTTRVTLAQAHEYEKALKTRLVELAKKKPEVCDRVLRAIRSGDKLKKGGSKKKDKAAGAAAEGGEARDEIEIALDASSKADTVSSLVDLAVHLHALKHTPCITFQLDSVRCQTLFDGMLAEIEAREEKKYPDYRTNLIKQQRGLEKVEKKMSKQAGQERKREEDELPDAAVAQEFGEVSSTAIDVDAPHPEFTLAPAGKAIGLSEATDIRAALRDDLPSKGEVPHPLIRALRRGVGVYIEGLPSSYHRVVQSLAQRGALGIVFSDELLAYGVNMPFRTACFFGDPGKNWLTPLLHQQMAGRAGRRGLDRQGHLVYAGFTPDRIRELLKGELPDVVGRFPLYPTIPLQLTMNTERYNVAGTKLTEEKMRVICRTPLKEFLEGKTVPDYYDNAKQWMEVLGLRARPAYDFVPELVWELRRTLPESLALEYCMDTLIRKYKNNEMLEGDKDTALQWAVMLLFSRICAREPFDEQLAATLPSWYGKLPSPHAEDKEWAEWSAILDQSQERILKSGLPYQEQLLLPHRNADLDNMCYASFVRNQIDPALPTPLQHRLRERLWDVGEVLRITANFLLRSPELKPVQHVVRKTFIRIRYILDETFERHFAG